MEDNNPSCLLYGPGHAEYHNRAAPTLDSPHDVLIRIAYTGVCGSDVHFWKEGGFTQKVDSSNPITLGHEASGTIVAVGSAVPASELKVGDHVALEPGSPCLRCRDCKSGKYNLCDHMRFAASPGPGEAVHGTLCKFFKLPYHLCYRLPSHVSLQEGVLVEPLAVAVHVVKLVHVCPGDRVVVFGAGTVGILCCAVAREFGAKSIVSVDVNTSRLDFVRSFAASKTYIPKMELSHAGNAEAIVEASGGPVDVVIDATGAAPCINMGIHALRKGGRYVQTGLGKPEITFPIVLMSEKELNVHGCFRYGSGDFELAVDLLETRRISIKELITKIVEFEKAPEAWEATARGEGIKTLIRGVDD